MRILIIGNYYYPEAVGAGLWIRQLALGLRDRGHEVTVLTSFPSYPAGSVFPEYRGKHYMSEKIDGIAVIRTLTYATSSKKFWPKCVSFGAFSASCLAGGLAVVPEVDVIYAILPPLPLGVSAAILSAGKHAPLVVNVQDLYPDIAISMGYLTNHLAIDFFQSMEQWIYRKASRIVVISDGFRHNLIEKHVAADKIAVVPNWADPRAIRPGPRDNAFRRQLGVGDCLLVVYSGGLTQNSDLGPVLEVAAQLANQPIRFAIVGDGIQRESLERIALELKLNNVQFLPFQPPERYPDVLAAADCTLVTLHAKATYASVPSKIYKQMAAARAVIAITNGPNELTRLVQEANCGYTIQPDDPVGLANVLRACLDAREQLGWLGRNGRAYLERECSLDVCVDQIEQVLREAADRPVRSRAGAAA